VTLYSADGETFYEVANWARHQRVDNAGKPKVPAPCDGTPINPRETRRESPRIAAGTGNREQGDGAGNREQEGSKVAEGFREPANNEFEVFRLRIGAWFKRRPSTVWSERESKALKAVWALKTPPDEINALEAHYNSGNPYLRRDILTLLNNWNTEIDRAKQPTATQNESRNAVGSTFRPASVIAQRNAILGPGADAHADEASRRSRARDKEIEREFDELGIPPFGERLPKVPPQGPSDGRDNPVST
jgi:hypothetical protein